MTPSEMVEDSFRRFATSKNISYGTVDDRGRRYYRAQAQVDKASASADWARARALAYEEALLKIWVEHAKGIYGRNEVELLNELEENNSEDAETFPEDLPTESRLQAIVDKLLKLADEKLNEKLREIGIDPAEFSAKPAEQKKTLFRKEMVKKMMTRAVGSVTGIMPIQTIEGSDGAGTHSIGVIAVHSPKTQQLAHDIQKGKAPLLTGKPKKKLQEQIPRSAKDRANMFGVRVLFDENGSPCIVSYGQWSHNYTGSSLRQRERRNESALRRARELADAQITLFTNANLSFSSDSTVGQAIEEVMVKDGDGNERRDEINKVIDTAFEKAKATARSSLAGRRDFDTWRYRHPYGQEISGCIRVWTIESKEAADAVRNWRPEQRLDRSTTTNVTPGGTAPAGVIQSPEEIELDDF
ncbi:MAG: DUF6844 domain-containing protein [Planctomycetota bacterium]